MAVAGGGGILLQLQNVIIFSSEYSENTSIGQVVMVFLLIRLEWWAKAFFTRQICEGFFLLKNSSMSPRYQMVLETSKIVD